jgi:hypothetical protein
MPEVQLSVMKLDIKAHVHPVVSSEVDDDVDEVYAMARSLPEPRSCIRSPTRTGDSSSSAIRTGP